MSNRKMSLSDCGGCYNDFYNGHNEYGVKQCWNFKTATLEPRLLIHIDQPPPYHQKPMLRPTCYKAQRHVTVRPEALTKEGYWK